MVALADRPGDGFLNLLIVVLAVIAGYGLLQPSGRGGTVGGPSQAVGRSSFEEAFEFVLEREGGMKCIDVPGDRGGRTNGGITQRFSGEYVRDRYGLADVCALSRLQVAEIYRDKYWRPAGCDRALAPLGTVCLSTSVLNGPNEAKGWMGQLDQSGSPRDQALRLLDLREADHRAQPPDQRSRFLKGWLNRVDTERQYVRRWQPTAIAAPSGQGDIHQRILAQARKVQGASSRTGPGAGRLACAWALNRHVLHPVTGKTWGDNPDAVIPVVSAMKAAGAIAVPRNQCRDGDIVAHGLNSPSGGSNQHIGVFDRGGSWNNSSSAARWRWSGYPGTRADATCIRFQQP